MYTFTLDDAVDLIPEAWHEELAGHRTLRYAAATGGLRTETIRRVQRHFAAREDDPDWLAMPLGQQLDECFPRYNGIGSFELLDELGVVTVYTDRACRTPALECSACLCPTSRSSL